MAQDIFGRIVSIDDNVSAIKAQLLQSVGAKTANTGSTDDKPVEKLIKQIDTITGYNLDQELKKFKDSLEDIRKIYDDMAAKKAQRRSSGSAGVTSASESLQKSLTKVIKQTEASLVDFGTRITEALDKVTKQISKAAETGKIPGAPAAAKKSTKDLADRICECLKELTGGRGGRGKGRGRGLDGDDDGYGGRRGRRGWRPPPNREYARRLDLAKAKGDEYDRGRGKGGYLPGRAMAGYDRLQAYSTDSAEGKKAIVNDIVTGVSKGVGGVVGGLTALLAGPLAGGFVGGFAEGLISLIFKPLAEQFEALSQRATLIYSQIGSDAADAALKQKALLFANEDVLEVGVSLSKLEKTRNKNAKKGITDAKVLRAVTKTGLQLSSQIGSNAEETADMFGVWNTQLDLSANKLNVISRNMLTVSRQTGLTGDNLLKVAQQSQSFMTNMRNAGTFTANAANNIIGFLARAEKTGTSAGARNILEVLKGSVLNAGDQDTANLLLQAAGRDMDVQDKLTKGTALNDKRSLKVLGSGMRNLLQQVLGRFGATSMKQLTPEQAGEADLVMKGLTRGKYGAKEIELISEHLEDLGKNFGEQIKDIEKSKKLTVGEKQTQIQDLTYNAAAAALSDFTDILERRGGNVNASFEELNRRSADLAPLLKTLGVDANKSGDAIGALIDLQHKQLMEDAKKFKLESKFGELGITDEAIKKAKGGDREALSALQEGFNEIQRRIAEEKRATTDPAFAVQRNLELLRATIDNEIAKVLAAELPKISKWLTEKMPEFQEWIKANVPKIIDGIAELITWATKNFDVLVNIAKALGIAYVATKVGGLVGGMGGGGVGGGKGAGGNLRGAAGATALTGLALVIADQTMSLIEFNKGVDEWRGKIDEQTKATIQNTENLIKNSGALLKKSPEELQADIAAAKKQQEGLKQAQKQLNEAADSAVVRIAEVLPWTGDPAATRKALQAQIDAEQNLARTKEIENRRNLAIKQAQARPIETERRITSIQSGITDQQTRMKKEQEAIDKLKEQFEAEKERLGWRVADPGIVYFPSKLFENLKREIYQREYGMSTGKNEAGIKSYGEREEDFRQLAMEKAALKKAKADAIFEMNKDKVPERFHETLRVAAEKLADVAPNFDTLDVVSGKIADELLEFNSKLSQMAGKAINLMDANKDLVFQVAAAQKKMDMNTALKKMASSAASDFIAHASQAKRKEFETYMKSVLGLKAAPGTTDFGKELSEADPEKFRDALKGYISEYKDDSSLKHALAELTEAIKKRNQQETDPAIMFKQASLQRINDWFKNNAMNPNAPAQQKAYNKIARGDVAGETLDQTLLRKRLALTKEQQSQLGITDSSKLDMGLYNELANVLYSWEPGGEGTKKFLEENAKRLDENIVREMFKSFGQVLPKTLEDKIKIERTAEEKRLGAELQKLAQNGNKGGSIFTHDMNVEESLEWIWESIESISSNSAAIIERLDTMIELQSEIAAVSAMLPGIDVEEEIKKRQMNAGTGTSEIVANTGETAENTRRTAILMGALLNCFRRAGRGRATNNIAGENLDESPFFDQFIDCEWVDTTARSTAYVWKQGNIGKKN